MARFKIVGRNIENKKIKKIVDAKSDQDVFELMKIEDICVYEIEEVLSEERTDFKFNKKLEADFCRQLSSMLSSGVPLIKSIRIMEMRESNKKAIAVFQEIYSFIYQGNSLTYALNETNSFDTLLISLLKSGEENGQLAQTCAQAAVYYENQNKIESKIKNAMIYPKILMGVSFLAVMAIFTIVLPKFEKIFEKMELPAITKFFIMLSNSIMNNWIIYLIGILLLLIIIKFLLKRPMIAYSVDKIKLELPLIGDLWKKIYTGRFARTMASLYSCGVVIDEAVALSASTVDNLYIQKQLMMGVNKINQGQPLSRVLQEVKGFDAKLMAVIYVGEESGELYKLLYNMADSFDYESENSSNKMVALMEPIMIVFLACVVFLIVISVLLPILQSYSVVGG
ncbi:MAG: type II secretion system F family protein [Erysipelotrichaceae bacterium]